MDRYTRDRKGPRSRDGLRPMVAITAIGAVLATGAFATRKIEIAPYQASTAIALGDDDSYTGSILFMPDDGNICRQILFDNRTGRLSDNGLVDCERASYRSAGEMPKSWSRGRIIAEGFFPHH